jgi:hypothetical protein
VTETQILILHRFRPFALLHTSPTAVQDIGGLNMPETMPVQEFVYEEIVQMTEMVDFGIDMQSALSGAKKIPPEGVRVNGSFEGEIKGPKIEGKVAGTDYGLIRGDGIIELDAHAVITTSDGEHISYYADGITWTPEGAQQGELRANVTLQTASPKYSWVNRRQFWATGQFDQTGKITLRGYSA